MTHRVALVLSIVLTLALSAGVVVGRDRLFEPEAVASPATATSRAAQSPGSGLAVQGSTTAPRIVTVTLPTTAAASAPAQVRGERGEGSNDHDNDDHDRGDDGRSEHDGEHDDD